MFENLHFFLNQNLNFIDNSSAILKIHIRLNTEYSRVLSSPSNGDALT